MSWYLGVLLLVANFVSWCVDEAHWAAVSKAKQFHCVNVPRMNPTKAKNRGFTHVENTRHHVTYPRNKWRHVTISPYMLPCNLHLRSYLYSRTICQNNNPQLSKQNRTKQNTKQNNSTPQLTEKYATANKRKLATPNTKAQNYRNNSTQTIETTIELFYNFNNSFYNSTTFQQ